MISRMRQALGILGPWPMCSSAGFLRVPWDVAGISFLLSRDWLVERLSNLPGGQGWPQRAAEAFLQGRNAQGRVLDPSLRARYIPGGSGLTSLYRALRGRTLVSLTPGVRSCQLLT